jgi:2'-5' RNA ligase
MLAIDNSGVEANPLILTLKTDESSQRFFNEMRNIHFPPQRNFLQAHLTLFHQLPNDKETFQVLTKLNLSCFEMEVSGLINLGAGVAYKIQSPELNVLRKELSISFNDCLIPQDKQGFRAHITIQNKTTPEQARALLAKLSKDFEPFVVIAKGLDLWEYLGGPWRYKMGYNFL